MTTRATRQYITLGLLLLWAFTAQLTYSAFVIYRQATNSRHAALAFNIHPYSTIISDILPGYEHSGLRVGDNLVALNGQLFKGEYQLDMLRFNSAPGDTINATVERAVNGTTERITVPVGLHAAPTQWTNVITLSVLLPLSCLIVGFYIALARPRDPLAWITLAMLVSFGQLAGSGVTWAVPSPWRQLLLIYHFLLSNSWPLWLVLFAAYFPEPFQFWRRHSWLNWLLALPFIGLTGLDVYGYFEAGMHLRELHRLDHFFRANHTAINLLFTAFVMAFFFLLGRKKRVVRSPDARRRLSVMIAGCSAALTPILLLVFWHPPPWLVTICLVMLEFFPLTMAYVIVVQRAMEVRMVVRSGVRYAVASNGVKALRLILITALAVLTIRLEQQSTYRWQGILIAAVGVAVIVMAGRLVRRLSGWMDRRFFREAYNAELILTDLGSSVAGIRDVKTLLQTVAQRISDSLHVERIAVLLERGTRYQPAYALGFGNAYPPIELARDAATVRMLRLSRSPSRIYFDDPQSWVHGAPEPEQTVLQTLRTQVLLPVSLNSRLLGLISLGAKRSEAPYSQGDLQLLSAVASQTGMALENAELTETIRREIAERERLDRELEIAREVQQRLFPQKLPDVQGLEFAGYCRPALGVGGDYYDFVRLPDGCLGIAIGDVSGKGIAAALMMASLQASLRGQTIKPCATLSEMIQHVNRLVYEASSDNRYATFFYAQYEPNGRSMRYVNAGHNAPMLIRRKGEGVEIQRLEQGGTVLGIFPDAPYEEGCVTLETGDVLIAFTDGISEAMNEAEEEYDEPRLMAAIQNRRAHTAADLISELLRDVDSFTAGARQHDDMTLVVIQVQSLKPA